MIKNPRKTVFIGIVSLLTVVILSLGTILSQEAQAQVEVEVQTGPAFEDGDASKAENCTMTKIKEKFPFDFLKGNISNGSGCPNIKLFGYDNEMCWIVDIWIKIEPAFITSLFVYGIFNW